MKLAVVSTTIHDESGYLAFDAQASKSNFDEVIFIVSGDLKTPAFHTSKFRCPIEYLAPADQKKYKCSEVMGWNKIARRNIALLRAIERQPDYILIVDDDNIPPPDYFERWQKVISYGVARRVIGRESESSGLVWTNYLKTADTEIEIYPRGFPLLKRQIEFKLREHRTVIPPEQIGVFQGISYGDPDIDAITRIVYPCRITKVKEINYCLNGVWSVYNTQNTMLSRKIFPLGFVWPFCGRYDDIYASFVWQSFMFKNSMYGHIGEAVNYQERGSRNISLDLEKEVEGYFKANEVAERINKIAAKDPLSFIEGLIVCDDNEIIRRHRDFFKAYLKDLEQLL